MTNGYFLFFPVGNWCHSAEHNGHREYECVVKLLICVRNQFTWLCSLKCCLTQFSFKYFQCPSTFYAVMNCVQVGRPITTSVKVRRYQLALTLSGTIPQTCENVLYSNVPTATVSTQLPTKFALLPTTKVTGEVCTYCWYFGTGEGIVVNWSMSKSKHTLVTIYLLLSCPMFVYSIIIRSI